MHPTIVFLLLIITMLVLVVAVLAGTSYMELRHRRWWKEQRAAAAVEILVSTGSNGGEVVEELLFVSRHYQGLRTPRAERALALTSATTRPFASGDHLQLQEQGQHLPYEQYQRTHSLWPSEEEQTMMGNAFSSSSSSRGGAASRPRSGRNPSPSSFSASPRSPTGACRDAPRAERAMEPTEVHFVHPLTAERSRRLTMMNDAEAERERLLSHAPSNTTTGTSAAAAALPGSPAHDGFEADGTTTTMPPLLVRISEADGWWALLGGGANDSGIHHSSNSSNMNNNNSSSRGGGSGLLSWLFPRVFVSLSHGSRAARTEAEGSVDPYDYYSPLRLRSDGFAASFRRAFASDEEDEDHWAVLEEDLGEGEVHHRLGQRSGRSRSRRRSRRQRQRQRQHDDHHHYHPQHDHSDNDDGEFSRFTEGIPIEIRLQPRRHRPRHTMEVLLHNRRIRIRFGRIPVVPDAEPTPIALEWAYHRERERQQQQRNEARACGSRSSGCNSGGGRPRAEYPYGCATYQSRPATEPAPYPIQPTPQTTAMPC